MGHPDPEDDIDDVTVKEAFVRSYIYEIEFMDTHVGRLLDGLKERGLYDNTLIVFTSDHGEEFCEHGGWWHGLSLYDEQIAVPLIIKLPGNAVAGKTNPYLTRHVDLGPTLLWFAGAEQPGTMLGQPLFFSDLQPSNGMVSDTYAALDFEGIALQAVRTNNRKLIKSNENKRNYAPIELYNLDSDPEEQVNLAGKDLPEESELLALVDSALERAKADAVAAQEVDIDAVREQMEATGYLGDDTED
jgi:arylsulfatase A-like enzyme